MTSRDKIKIHSETELKLRPLWLGDFSLIRRLYTMMKKNKQNSILLKILSGGTEKVLEIVSPISNSLMGFKNMIKKNIFKAFSSIQSEEELKEIREVKRKSKRSKYRKNYGTKHREFIHEFEEENAADAKGINTNLMQGDGISRKYHTRQFKNQNTCFSCQEDLAACKTCSSCFKMDPSLPHSSCAKCQEKGPLVNLCTRFHNKQPIMHLPDNTSNFEIFNKFKQRRQILKEVSKFCKGNSPKINHCPMCSSMKPQIGDCACKNCKKNQPIVKLAKRDKKTVVQICPCQQCSYLRPKTKVCEECKNYHLNKTTSYYVLLSSK